MLRVCTAWANIAALSWCLNHTFIPSPQQCWQHHNQHLNTLGHPHAPAGSTRGGALPPARLHRGKLQGPELPPLGVRVVPVLVVMPDQQVQCALEDDEAQQAQEAQLSAGQAAPQAQQAQQPGEVPQQAQQGAQLAPLADGGHPSSADGSGQGELDQVQVQVEQPRPTLEQPSFAAADSSSSSGSQGALQRGPPQPGPLHP